MKQLAGKESSGRFAYSDEAGHSGINVFDEAQPDFWAGTLVTQADLDTVDPAVRFSLLTRAGVSELHGNGLGLSRLEKIAGKLKLLFLRYDTKFFFARVNKRHFLAMKFADTVLDNGLNDAVSAFHYGVRFNRLYFAHVLATLIDEAEERLFWEAYTEGRPRPLGSMCDTMFAKVNSLVPDPRTKQILCDALRWATLYPDKLLEGRQRLWAAPNIPALSLVISALHDEYGDSSEFIASFVHDEQQQFGRLLREAFDVSKRFNHVRGAHPLSFMSDIREMKTFVAEFTARKSTDSFGIQLLDVALWLVRRMASKESKIYGCCAELGQFILSRSNISKMTRQQLFAEVKAGFAMISSRPLPPERLQDGRRLMEQMERARVERMNASIPNQES